MTPGVRRPARFAIAVALAAGTFTSLPGTALAADTTPVSAAAATPQSSPARFGAAPITDATPLLPRTPSRGFAVHRSVTHGTAVASPNRSVPWAVSLWFEPKDASGKTGTNKTRFICSATAISPTELVTAAHCTKGNGYLYVLAGARDFADHSQELIPVGAVRAHSGYQDSRSGNDIAMLRSLTRMHLTRYAHLATPSIAKAARAGTRPLRIYGWGDTEDGTLTGRLRTTALQQQQTQAATTFGRAFVPTRMIAAGRRLGASGRYAGGCSGDSGGPLVTTVGQTTYLVGVTDFGLSAACDKGPTVFASVGDYTAWEAQTRRVLPQLARTHNAALPVPLSPPTITGTAAIGGLLQCLPGKWSSNVGSGQAVTAWLRGKQLLSIGTDHVVTAEDAGGELLCLGEAKSAAGFRAVGAVDLVRLPTLPTANGLPIISGLSPDVVPAAGTVASCGGVAPDAASTTTYDWLLGTTPDPATAIALAGGPTLTLDQPTIDRLAGHYLICRATTANAMGAAASVTVMLVASPPPPPPPATPATAAPVAAQP